MALKCCCFLTKAVYITCDILFSGGESGLKSEVAAEETAAAAVQDQDEGQQGSQIVDFHSSANRISPSSSPSKGLYGLFGLLDLGAQAFGLKTSQILQLILLILVIDDRVNCS